MLSLIIPIFNEASHLNNFLQKIDTIDLGIEKELVLVDDCSTDQSLQILENFAFQSKHVLIAKKANAGKGAALRDGIAKASGDIIGIQDADFEYNMEDIPKLIRPILEKKVDVVYGSRFDQGNPQVHRTFHYLANRFLTLLSNIFSGLYLTDMETCYKFFKADILQNVHLSSNRFGFEPEITAKIARLRIHMWEVPISYYPRNYFQGKKITWKDGVAAIYHIIYYNTLESKFLTNTMPQQYRTDKRIWL